MTEVIELNFKKLLLQSATSQSSGNIRLKTESVLWEICLYKGIIRYVYCSVQTIEQIEYYLNNLGFREAVAALEKLPRSITGAISDNKSVFYDLYAEVIYWLLAEKYLNVSQVAKLISFIAQKEIQYCLWLKEGVCEWQEGDVTPVWIDESIRGLLSLSVAECCKEAQIMTRQWQQCSEIFESVHQRPYFPPSWETKPLPTSGSLNHKTLMELTKVLKGRTSIRQLSILLKKEELKVALILSPYLDCKIIYLHHPPAPLNLLPSIPRNTDTLETLPFDAADNPIASATKSQASNQKTKVWQVVCIDDSPTILSEIRRFLDPEKYQITAIDDPIKAASKVFTIAPDVILLDITMPKINGYKLCGLLRSSGKCNDTPIIMVTGNTGLIDKARAKLAGATDYFTKPFTQEGLNKIVGKYLPQ